MDKMLIILGYGMAAGYLVLVLAFVIASFIPGDKPDTVLRSLLRRHYALIAWFIARIFRR
jgi:hypothetical protein